MTKITLLRSAAVGAVLTFGMGAAAHAADSTAAKPVHHKKHHAVAAKPVENPLVGEVAALKAEVASLEQRLDASSTAAQQAQAAAQQAQASAQAAQTAAQNEQAEISKIPGDVDAAVAKLPKPKLSALDGIGIFDANTKLGGTLFYDFSNIDQHVNGKKVAPSGTGFDLKRAYISIDHKFNDVWSANITTDTQYSTAGQLTNTGTATGISTTALNSTEFYVKKAYVQGAFSKNLTVRLGAADLPWIPFAEGVYGFRYVENTLAERDKFGTSADWGVHALGNFFDGHVGYAVSVVNGVGYKEPGQPALGGALSTSQGHTQGVDIEGRLNVNFGPFVAAVGGYDGQRGNNIAGNTNVHHTADRFNALLAYSLPKNKGRVGVEYFSEDNWNSITKATSDRANGVSGFGNYSVTPKITVFGRYDYIKPTTTATPNTKDNYFNFGVQYEPVKVLDFSLVYKRDKIWDGNFGTQNGTIGGTSAITNGSYDEIGLFGQVKF